MVKKNVLKRIGVFAMTVMLASAPIMAVSAAGSTLTSGTGGTGSTGSTGSLPTPTPTPTPEVSVESSSDDSSESNDNYVVVTAAGTELVSTVNGVYAVSCVPGVAFTTPKSQIPSGLEVEVRNSARGPLAEASINDGLAILASNGVAAVKGPEIDMLAYLKGVKTINLDGKVTVSIGIPAEFKQAGYDYAVMLIQEGGRVSILPDKKTDAASITVDTPGFGVYVLVKAPAGSFDKFR